MARSKLTLQDVARTASDRNGGKGGRALQRIAKSKGLTLSYATVDRILAGKYESTPQRQTIEALAVLAEMPVDEVYEAAGLPLPMASLAEALPEGSDQLTVHQRRVVLDVIRGFVRDNARMADLEHELHQRPLHPNEMLRRLNELSIPDMDTEALHELLDQLALLIPDDADEGVFVRAEARAREVLERREAGGSDLEDPPQPDGVTPAAGELRVPVNPRHAVGPLSQGWVPPGLTESGEARYSERRPRQSDYDRAADDSGPSLLEADDARAAALGEESQDPGNEEPA
ncbi:MULTISPECIES: hypothetical protein [Brachybacterium]|uniref:Uncharacterized protein n=2 Tax=Brachybacterium TaxID=43668 RepID=A0A3R8QUJ6_9MICO|nr:MULTISPECIES: hypothetical protein [Brachybacterium]RRR18287.1 hypothetical protein DS079_11110 [Brachybacterium paraconglomeratum]GLI30398.1 hypothetical protein BCONGLO52_12390 [Brachybacterium conglomeratum]GLK04937.1 hypothetical protein GCM10017597_17370 [Brachybacterium conglomeratum]